MKKEEPNNSLWAYTTDRKWKPLHNTGAFDGYDKEGVHFESIEYNNGNVSISKLINEEMPADVLKINKIAENKMHKVGYYFWQGGDNVFYLIRENNDTNYSIWHYTTSRQWQPIHNADDFDGFAGAGHTMQDISLDKNTSTLTLGAVDRQSINYDINLKSSDLSETNHYNSEFFNVSPSLSWSVSDSLKDKVKKFVVIMKNTTTNDLIWSRVISSEDNNLSKGIKGERIVIPNSGFCAKSYEHNKIKENIVNVSIAIYAINNLSILENIKCSKEVETNNIVSSEINATMDVSILSNMADIFYEHTNNDGSIKNRLLLEFKDNTFSGKLDLPLVKISNLPKGLTSSYAIDNSELYITLEGKADIHEGIKQIQITLDKTLWDDDVSNQIISTSIVFLDNARDIRDIQQEQYYKYSWHQKPLDKLGPISISSDAHMNIEKAWGITRGKGVVVAVIDTNFDLYHSDLIENFQSSFNASTGSTDVSPPNTGSSHGTLVSGVIGASVNGIGTVGSAPESKMLFINFPFVGGRVSDTVKAFDYAQTHGAKVINCSWGGAFVSDGLRSKIQELYDEGIIILFATGNDNANIDYVDTAAESKLPTVLGVGASNEFNIRAGYSNYGSTLDFVAPGGKYGVPTTDVSGNAGSNNTQNLLDNDYTFATGTSLATPNATGVVALMLSVNPNLNTSQVKDIITSTADKIAGGYNNNGVSVELGYGKINAYKAVVKAQEMIKK